MNRMNELSISEEHDRRKIGGDDKLPIEQHKQQQREKTINANNNNLNNLKAQMPVCPHNVVSNSCIQCSSRPPSRGGRALMVHLKEKIQRRGILQHLHAPIERQHTLE